MMDPVSDFLKMIVVKLPISTNFPRLQHLQINHACDTSPSETDSLSDVSPLTETPEGIEI